MKKRRFPYILLAVIVFAILLLLVRCPAESDAPKGGESAVEETTSDDDSSDSPEVQPEEEVESEGDSKTVTYDDYDAEFGDSADSLWSAVESLEGVKVYFRQGSARLDESYMGNAEALAHLSELLEPYIIEDAPSKGKVRISSSVSPEGTNFINQRLIKARASAISKWISRRFDVEIGYVVEAMGVDWASLVELIEESEEVPYKEEVLELLRNTPEKSTNHKGRVVNERRNRLEKLHNGEPYRYIYTHIYPKLRYAVASAEIWYASEIAITSESPVKFSCEGGEGVITFRKNVEDKVVPRVVSPAEWLGDIAPATDRVEFRVAPNEMAEVRHTKVYIECYGQTYEVEVVQEGAEPVLSITSELERNFGVEGGRGTIDFTTNSPEGVVPEVTNSSEWIGDVVASPEGVSFSVAPNEIAAPRTDTIRVSCFDKVQEVVVNQDAAEARLRFTTETPRYFAYTGATDTVRFKTNSPERVVPTAQTDAEWISHIALTDSLITYKVARNRNYESRTATIKVECFDKTYEIDVYQSARPDCSNYYGVLKTNALYDLALIPNIGFELRFGRNFTIGANWHYAWWKSDAIHWYWRTYGGDVSARYYFGKEAERKAFTGHHVGVYGQIITYDFLLGKNGILADRWSYGYGVEYGYSWALTKRLNFDMTLGVGYHTGQFYEYMSIDDCYVWQATKNRKYIGPTKLEFSLVWLFGCGDSSNQTNGGGR